MKGMKSVERTVRYLNNLKNLILIINTTKEKILKTYADCDWSGGINTRKSTSGNLFLLSKYSIQWVIKTKTWVALSLAEAEYVSAANADEIIWIVIPLEDQNLPQILLIELLKDHESCIKMKESEKHISKTKHVDIKLNDISHLKKTRITDIRYCSIKLPSAEFSFKPTPKSELKKHRLNLKLQPHPTAEIKREY